MSDDVTTEQDDLTFEVTVTATNGVQVPLEIQVKYPAGYGFYAAKALEAMPNNMDGIWNGRLSELTVPYGTQAPLVGRNDAEANNPYRRPE